MKKFRIAVTLLLTLAMCFSVLAACKSEKTAPAAPEISVSGKVVSWTAVADAQSYDIYINGDKETNVTEASYELAKTEPAEYKIKVKAIKDELESGYSNTVSITVNGTLSTPVLSKSGATVSWEAVTNAAGYIVRINDVEKPQQTATTFTVPANIGSYRIAVKAMSFGNLWLSSGYSSETTVNLPQLAVPQNLSASGLDLSWTVTEGAAGYKVSLYPENKNTEIYFFDTTTASLNLATKAIAVGVYNVTVLAKGNNVSNFDSDASSAVEVLKGTRFEAPSNLEYATTTSNGVTTHTLKWDEVSGANGYNVYNGNKFLNELSPANYTIVDGVVSYNFSAAPGTYEDVKVQTAGNASFASSAKASFEESIALQKILRVYYWNPNDQVKMGSGRPRIQIHWNMGPGGQNGGAFLEEPPTAQTSGDLNFTFGASTDAFFKYARQLPLSIENSTGSGQFALDIGLSSYDLETDFETGSKIDNDRRHINFAQLAQLWENKNIGTVYLVVGIDTCFTDREEAIKASATLLSASIGKTTIYDGQESELTFSAGRLDGKIHYVLSDTAMTPARIKASPDVATVNISRRATEKVKHDFTELIEKLTLIDGTATLYMTFEDNHGRLSGVITKVVEVIPTTLEISEIRFAKTIGEKESSRVTIVAGRTGVVYYLISDMARDGITSLEVIDEGETEAVVMGENSISFVIENAGDYWFYAVLVDIRDNSGEVECEEITVTSDIRILNDSLILPKAVFEGYEFSITVEATKQGELYCLIGDNDELLEADVKANGQKTNFNSEMLATVSGLDITKHTNKYLYLLAVLGDEVSFRIIELNVADELVTTFAEFSAILTKTGTVNTKYFLTKDIVCDETVTPGKSEFGGAIYGNGYTVSGLTLAAGAKGMFKNVRGGSFHDITFVSPKLTGQTGDDPRGFFAEVADRGTITIDNVMLIGLVIECTGKSRGVGGLFGRIESATDETTTLNITNSYIDVLVQSMSLGVPLRRTGGLAGEVGRENGLNQTITINISNTYIAHNVREWATSDQGDSHGGLFGRGQNGVSNLPIISFTLNVDFTVISFTYKLSADGITYNNRSNNAAAILGDAAGSGGGLKGVMTFNNVIVLVEDSGRNRSVQGGTVTNLTFKYDDNSISSSSAFKTKSSSDYNDYSSAFVDNGSELWEKTGSDDLVFKPAEVIKNAE